MGLDCSVNVLEQKNIEHYKTKLNKIKHLQGIPNVPRNRGFRTIQNRRRQTQKQQDNRTNCPPVPDNPFMPLPGARVNATAWVTSDQFSMKNE